MLLVAKDPEDCRWLVPPSDQAVFQPDCLPRAAGEEVQRSVRAILNLWFRW